MTDPPKMPTLPEVHLNSGVQPRIITADERSTSSDTNDVVDLEALAALMASVLASEGIPGGAEASITLVDSSEIAQLKSEHLDGDGSATDVLSFPIDGREGSEAIDDWLVGDIVLCPEVAALQADGHAGTMVDELALLVVHGALHLVGWDHDEEEERTQMWARERQLMETLHGPLTRDPWEEEIGRASEG